MTREAWTRVGHVGVGGVLGRGDEVVAEAQEMVIAGVGVAVRGAARRVDVLASLGMMGTAA